jgi:hypothetical protein
MLDQDPAPQRVSPFSPGYGKQPLVYGGHDAELRELSHVFESLDFGENHSILVSGLRGSGKTSMLLRLQEAARDQGWLVIGDDASAGLMERVMDTTIPALLNSMAPEARRRLKRLGIWRLDAEWEYVERDRHVAPLLRRDLLALSQNMGLGGILITIDEVSSGKTRLRELSRFALEISHALSDGANIMVVFAGVKVNLEALLDQEHTTFLRRSKELDFRRLSPDETRYVLSETVRIGGRQIDEDALDLLVQTSQGYPYLLQLAGDYAWRSDPTARTITLADARSAHRRAVEAVQNRVIRRVYQDLSEKDQLFIQAMAADEGRSRMSDIARRMEVSDQYAQVYKRRLIDSGYVRPAGRGHVVFALPYLDQYVRAMMNDSEEGRSPGDEWAAYPPPDLP